MNTPIEVLIDLDLTPSQSETFHIDYLKLDQRNYITQNYDKVKNHFDDFIEYVEIMKRKGNDPTKTGIFEIFYINESILDLKCTETIHKNECNQLLSKKNKLISEIQKLQHYLDEHDRYDFNM